MGAPSTVGGAAGAGQPVEYYVPPTPDGVFECTAGERACLAPDAALRCAEAGDAYAVERCDVGKGCHDPLGTCRLTVCEPGAATCVGDGGFRRCRDSGTGYEDQVEACQDGKTCWEGACLYCAPNRSFCLEPAATALCDAEGDGYRNPAKCKDSERCSESTGRCEPVICKSHVTKCAGPAAYRHCLTSGTGYEADVTPCASGHLCVDGQCVYAPCVPSVMLLVDASASMAAKWEQVRSSVVGLAADNPAAQFGLTFFPTNAGCKTTTRPDLPVGPHEPEALGAWFDTHPAIGGTPLASAMNDMVLGAAENFGGYGGALVLLSDGENACGSNDWSDGSGAAEAARALYADFGVRTFVIGFGYTGNEQQLDAIAAEGGTGMTTFVKTGDEKALANALGAVVEDFKSCLAQHP
ncbi:MAG: vWA domain-containing protein [Myxococcota bacterium]